MKLKVRTPTGTKMVTLSPEATVGDLLQELAQSGTAPTNNQHMAIRRGFPPTPMDVSRNNVPLHTLGVKHGEQLVIEYLPGPLTSPVPRTSVGSKEKEGNPRTNGAGNGNTTASRPPGKGQPRVATLSLSSTGVNLQDTPVYAPCEDGYIVLQVQPDDNSCLFNAILHCLYGSASAVYTVKDLREYVANTILAQTSTYLEVVLGKPPAAYGAWIRQPTSWGGAIEMQILAEFLAVRIKALDVESGHVYEFGGDADSAIAIVYSGIHYDALIYTPLLGDFSLATGVFSPATAWGRAFMAVTTLAIGVELRTKGYATNTSNFTLRCGECGIRVQGEAEAIKHGKSTGHTLFGEV